MKALLLAAREVWGLFVDDGSLAAAILALVVLLALLRQFAGLGAGACGALLFAGLILILLENVRRGARR